MYTYILRTHGGNFLGVRLYQGEPQYFLSTAVADAQHYGCLQAASHGAALGVEALALALVFETLAVEHVRRWGFESD